MSIPPTGPGPIARQAQNATHLSGADLAHAAGISVATLDRLVRLGVVDLAPGGGFTVATALRLRRILRLHLDLDVDLFGAAIIVDLLERLERLEAASRGR